MKAVLIDDEELALRYLEYQLEQIGGIEIAGKYSDPLQGMRAVEQPDIDIVFLDIHIPEINGLELAEMMLEHKPNLHVVFVTTYDQYAIKAFELNALDYLLKPIQLERLQHTLRRAAQRLALAAGQAPLSDRLRMRLFGEFAIGEEHEQQGRKLVWRTSRAQELFFYLLHHRGKTVGKAKLIELLWPDFDWQRATAQLYTTVYYIRKTLEPFGYRFHLHHHADGYMLRLEGVLLDTDEFEFFLQTEISLRSDTVAEHERVLDLFEGEYLGEAAYDWAEYDRQRYQMHWIRLKLNLVRWLYEREQFEKAFKHGDHLCSRYPLEEEAQFLFMKICDRMGLPFMVRKQFQLLESLMNKEFNQKPDAEITQWYAKWEETSENR